MASNETPFKGLSAEESIVSNLAFCIVIGTILFTTFCIIRRLLKGIYSPNVLNSRG